GRADAYGAIGILTAHSMHATYYGNTGVIGDSAHMSWSQLQDLFAAGNDIGAPTLTHANWKHLKTADARMQVCQDRDNLLSHGLQPTAFAYPFGSFDSGTEQVVAACGYNSGRGVSGVNDTRVYAETIPPADPYATRTPPNPKQGTTVATIEGYVTAAEQHGGGWVQVGFQQPCHSLDSDSITVSDFTALLDWLQPRAATGTTVETTAQVIGGPVNPPVPA